MKTGDVVRKIQIIPTLVSFLVILAAFVLAVVQLAHLYPFNDLELLSLVLILLALISGFLFTERIVFFRKILKKLDQLEQMIKEKKEA